MMHQNIALVGTVGVPATYGGFETLAENLVRYHYTTSLKSSLAVYCSSKSYPSKEATYLSSRLKYIPLNANGAQSIPYDIWSLFSAVWHRSNVILLLGVSGAIALPLVRLISSARVVTNIDGIEWRREKWQGLAKRFLRFSEKMAVCFSHEVIADNAVIAEYIKKTYGVNAHVIAYGGDHAIRVKEVSVDEFSLPAKYAFSVCRIEPENNVHVLLKAFADQQSLALVMVGNWNNSEYGRSLRMKYASCNTIFLLDPIYDLGKLKTLRQCATFYVHGHSAGGTNPSLVEAMHFSIPILAFDCDFNRSTTEDCCLYFRDISSLAEILNEIESFNAVAIGTKMKEIAGRRYTWINVAKQYFDLLIRR
jgi:glycosyltransferase involved in cell wall biosynthesis